LADVKPTRQKYETTDYTFEQDKEVIGCIVTTSSQHFVTFKWSSTEPCPWMPARVYISTESNNVEVTGVFTFSCRPE